MSVHERGRTLSVNVRNEGLGRKPLTNTQLSNFTCAVSTNVVPVTDYDI